MSAAQAPPPAPSTATPLAKFSAYLRRDLGHDFGASIVVFLVAIPLSLGVAAASGAPLLAGLIAAIIGGIIAGSTSRAPFQVSGASAGLTVVVAQLVSDYGFAATAAITIGAGLVQIALGASKVGRNALSLSPAVVHGMLAGIGIVIVIGQLHVLLGGSPQTSVLANLAELPRQLANCHIGALALGLLTIGVLLGWPLWKKTKWKALASVPAALIAVLGATLTAAAAGAFTHNSVPTVSLPADPLNALVTPRLPDASIGAITIAIATVAIIASVESLFSAVAVDKLHNGPRTNLDRELVAQGVGNIASGTLGGLPITGAIVRSSANVAAGARTRTSTIMHGVWVLLTVIFGVAMLEHIPLAALAAVLVVVGANLVSLSHIRMVHQHHELVPYVVTLGGVVFLNVLAGAALGLATAALLCLYRLTHTRIEVSYSAPGRWHASISGTVMFGAVSRLVRELSTIPPSQHTIIDLHTDFLDHAGYEALRDWCAEYERGGGHVEICEDHGSWFSKAHAGNPEHRKILVPQILPRWFAPWSRWQEREKHVDNKSEHPMLVGVQEFQQRGAPLVRPVLSELAIAGQDPHQLFITCADSRILPNLITTSGPGDLFCVRNVGNFVPRHGNSTDDSVGAGIEFAVDVLRITSIAVCGHSDCGAMKALLNKGQPTGSHLASWLAQGAPSLQRARSHNARPTPILGALRGRRKRGNRPNTAVSDGRPIDDLPVNDQLAIHNVIQQLEHLRSYPSVAAAQAKGRVELVGMFFDISTASVYLVDPVTTRLHQVDSAVQQAS